MTFDAGLGTRDSGLLTFFGMQLVTRNGKTYHEYTPQEIEAIRLRALIQYTTRRGSYSRAMHHLAGTNTIFAGNRTHRHNNHA